jgi:hypothetical protein
MTVRHGDKWLWTALLALGLAAGCSTSPVADILDMCSPGRLPPNTKGTTGGVCVPQGNFGGPPPPGDPVPKGPFGPAGVGELPPPAPVGPPPPGLPK